MRNLPSLILLVLLPVGLWAQSPHGEGLSFDCSACHNEQGWKIDMKSLTFDHNLTKYALTGQHAWVGCKNCHPTLVFSQARSECASCHTDIHQQTVGIDCGRCHSTHSWIVENITQIHQLSRFPLLGAHITADCQDCHPSASLLYFEPLEVECFACHEDDYNSATDPDHVAAQFSTNCTDCHKMNAFSWSAASINHNFFPLTEGHDIQDCSACHTTSDYTQTPSDCNACHQEDYIATSNPNHIDVGINEDCATCHTTNPGWQPASFTEHDAQYFPVYSGSHGGAWNSCTECHTSPGNYAEFNCIACHDHNQPDTDEEHNEVGGYIYVSQACLDCHPTGEGEDSFDHNQSNFPLTGAHLTTECFDCHTNGFSGTSTVCMDCHNADYDQTSNPNHFASAISTDCQLCHTTQPEWKPATFPNHSDYYLLAGAHVPLANDCFTCHAGDYNNTPNTCFGCHEDNYNQTINPPHVTSGFSTDCESCHSQAAWVPATFNHDGEYFPIYSGQHTGTWESCSECHTNPANYGIFSCIDCHEHNQGVTDVEHTGVGGYFYNSQACYECHPTGESAGSFDHNLSLFPLTGAHVTTPCLSCHSAGYTGTTTVCSDCHATDFSQSTNPNHVALAIPNTCETCHTTNPGWQPATFPIHNSYYPLQGAHAPISGDCFVCHEGNYTNTPNTCFACHEEEYNQTADPPHQSSGFSTDCESCHSQTAWTPATFNHDEQYFPIYSGEHTGSWESCSDCHTNPANYGIFSCVDCHAHLQPDMDEAHQGIGGYVYNSSACFECHPDGTATGSFNHNNSSFPLTGAHLTTECISCHATGYTGTTTICSECHADDYTGSTNPDHIASGIPNTCEECHTTNPGWEPATFPIHGNYYQLTGAHSTISNDCDACHGGNYTSTPDYCFGCHQDNYNQAANPNHVSLGLSTTCETCHTTNPGWEPATFPIHNSYWVFQGAHVSISGECDLCHFGNYTTTPNTCYGCHSDDYNQTSNPSHLAAQYPTDCELCHTQFAWVPSTFDHDNQYFPIYSGSHAGAWDQCSDCHPNQSNYEVFDCLSCHEQAETDEDHDEVTGYQYNSQACYNCHPTGEASAPKSFRRY